jgi:HK97 family phage prohead protease
MSELTDAELEARAAVWDPEHREGPSFKDRHRALSSAIRDQPDGGALSAYLTDFDDDTATYESGGKMFQVPYEEGDDGISLGDAQEVQPVTSYEPVDGRSEEPETEQRTAAWAAKERRKARAELVDGMPERRFWQEAWGPVGLELRERPEGIVQVGGYASVTECWYEVGDYEERAVRGFCRRTLGEKPDVMFLANHGDMPMGRTKTGSLRLEEPHRGLRYDVDLQLHDPDVKRLLPKLEREDMDESSFAFRARDQEWDKDYRKRSLIDVSLHKGDVSVVNFGANPAASAGLRAFEDMGIEHLGEAMVEARAGKAISTKNASEIKAAIEKLQGLLPALEPEPEAPQADPLAVIIPSAESERARRARTIAGAA